MTNRTASRLVGLDEAAELLDLGERQLRRAIDQGMIRRSGGSKANPLLDLERVRLDCVRLVVRVANRDSRIADAQRLDRDTQVDALPEPNELGEVLVSATQLSKVLGMSRQNVNKAAREGRLPVHSEDTAGRRLFSLSEVRRTLKAKQASA